MIYSFSCFKKHNAALAYKSISFVSFGWSVKKPSALETKIWFEFKPRSTITGRLDLLKSNDSDSRLLTWWSSKRNQACSLGLSRVLVLPQLPAKRASQPISPLSKASRKSCRPPFCSWSKHPSFGHCYTDLFQRTYARKMWVRAEIQES